MRISMFVQFLKRIAQIAILFSLTVVAGSTVLATTASAQDNRFSFSPGAVDGKLGALSRRPSPGKKETETADDFILTQTTVINRASITGLIFPATPLANITNVEVEIYHRFPDDSTDPPSGKVFTRKNSPSDVEIGTATRDASKGTLSFTPTLLNANFEVKNSVVDGIKPNPSKTGGDGAKVGEEVQIDITFTTPIILPAGHYFFRPEVLVDGGDFLFLSAPRPIVSPGTPLSEDLQAWIRNFDLLPDWVRIGSDIIVGDPATFNMAFSLNGFAVPETGTPGAANCHGQTISAVAVQFGGLAPAASSLGFSSVDALQNGFGTFCEP